MSSKMEKTLDAALETTELIAWKLMERGDATSVRVAQRVMQTNAKINYLLGHVTNVNLSESALKGLSFGLMVESSLLDDGLYHDPIAIAMKEFSLRIRELLSE